MPFSLAGCLSSPTEPIQTESQVQLQETRDKYSQLEAKLKNTEEKLAKKDKDYDTLETERDRLTRERDKLSQERGDYPRDTPEDIIKENKTLRLQLFKNDTTSSAGYRMLVDMLEDNRILRAENFGLKKENQAARDYLEGQGVYLSTITGKKTNITESPLYLEKAEHKATREKLKLEKAERDADKYYYEAQTLKSNQELAKIIQERDKLFQERDLYKKSYEQWKNYAKSLGGTARNPDTDSWQDSRTNPKQ